MDYAKLALEEYNDEKKSPHFGGANGKPFWNVNSAQFMYTPSFLFPKVIGATKYLYTATGSDGKNYSFEAGSSTAYLTPIWKSLPTGLTTLKVEALDKVGKPEYLSGTRTFFKLDPFPGRENLPERACSYRECATKALRFIFHDPNVQRWLVDNKPSSDFPMITYVSKTVGSIIDAMLVYAKLEPENAEAAIKIARCGADYLIETSYGEDTALAGIPRTYMYQTDEITEESTVPQKRKFMVMMIYPAGVGIHYLNLAKVTGEAKYFEAAMRIADFYKDTVLPNGSWPLLVSAKTGKIESEKCCVAFVISNFLREIGKQTGEAIWYELDENYFKYIEKTCHEKYDWQAQFEDAPVSDNYSNLTHIDADDMIMYLANNCSDDKKKLEEAEFLMRFVEDQFVVWGEFSPWISPASPKDEDIYCYSPAGLEQYNWYWPIDGSTAKIMKAFLELYKANKNPLLLEKACALGDSITRMQNFETGMIPTHWFLKDCMKQVDLWFWPNCHIGTAKQMMYLADFLDESK